jgi:hypothetical protein
MLPSNSDDSCTTAVPAVAWAAIFEALCAIMHTPPSHPDFKEAFHQLLLPYVTSRYGSTLEIMSIQTGSD